jgi:tRNA(Ile)-lysidine synthase
LTASAHTNPGVAALVQWGKRYPAVLPLPSAQSTPILVGVAYSAGADSTALLMAAHHLWPGQVVALHVHHGLQAAADTFEVLGRQVCAQHGIDWRVQHVDARNQPGGSPEAAARHARYRALATMASHAGVSVVLLGQHADDQAETLLLALSRGSGLPGLSAMPERFERHGTVFARPLLTLTSASLRDWVCQAGHTFVDDPSNTDERLTRNRIRAKLMPAWDACFPTFRAQLARSALHAAEAQSLLDELAATDLAQVGVPPVLKALQTLRRERQANVLRYWLRHSHGVAPSTAQLTALLDQVAACRTRGHHIHLKVAGGFVTRCGATLCYTPPI